MGRIRAGGLGATGLACTLMGATAAAQDGPARLLDRAEYRDRLRAMWLGEVIANWTGLQIEGSFIQPPFLTDAAWGQPPAPGYPPLDFVLQDPWLADDDTDIEYVYVHLLDKLGATTLTPVQIADGWVAHVNRSIWVSNAIARTLIGRGVLPPATGLGTANFFRLQIDAQLTTEVFGALCPGMPHKAIEFADLPIGVTASGHAAHASQFYVLLYSLATQADPMLPVADRILWMYRQARRYVPDGSKAADIADFVLADFLANPDPDNWERTRDLVHQRYQLNAASNGFEFRGWTESSVNFATGLIALLYGRGDLRRTVQIGTLSGWDCDNGTATMGGLLGLMNGTAWVESQFPGPPPGGALSRRFYAARTRDALPDYLPDDAAADDTFDLMAERMLPIVDRQIAAAGGMVDRDGNKWLLPPPVPWGDPASPPSAAPWNPRTRDEARSGNLAVRAAGGIVAASSTAAPSSPPFNHPYHPHGLGIVSHLANGVEMDYAGREANEWDRAFYSTENSGASPGQTVTFTVEYDRPVTMAILRFIEGNHFDEPGAPPPPPGGGGGWLESISAELRIGDEWGPVPAGTVLPVPDPARPFQILDWVLPAPALVTGIRITGPVGGTGAFATVAELDALSLAAAAPALASLDRDGDGRVSLEDLYIFDSSPADLDGDGDADESDRAYLELAARWRETADMAGGRGRRR